MGRSKQFLRIALRASIVATAYYASARLGLLLGFPHTNVTPVWPPSGIAVAALLVLGLRYWPVLLVSAFVVNATTGLAVSVAGGLAAGNTLEYLLAAAFLTRSGLDQRFRRIRDVTLLVVATLFAIVAPTIGVASLVAGHVVSHADAQTVGTIYLIGDASGILTFVPPILVWFSTGVGLAKTRREMFEALALAVVVVAVGGSIFVAGVRAAYLAFPLAIWAAVRFGQRGTTLTQLAVCALAVWGTIHGISFQHGSSIERIESLQFFLAAFELTALSLAAAVEGRREAERSMRLHAKRLEEANRELESFAYTIAHDLRAPVRAMDGYANVLSEELGGALPRDAVRALERITVNAELMGKLIDALLAFARLGYREIRRRRLAPEAIARSAYERVSTDLDGRAVDLVVAELPPCSADPALLGSVYQNLLENALKFTSERERARIDVGWLPSLEAPGSPVYYVRDNGVGFEMQYSSRLFGVFARLHPQDRFPGTGAGLAIAKRVVTRHGGRIWAVAEQGRGATFFFTVGAG